MLKVFFFSFQIWPNLVEYCKNRQAKISPSTGPKHLTFTQDQMDRFLQEASNENRYILVRKLIAIMAISGSQRAQDLRALSLGSVKQLPDGGFRVTHPNSDQKRVAKTRLIEKR